MTSLQNTGSEEKADNYTPSVLNVCLPKYLQENQPFSFLTASVEFKDTTKLSPSKLSVLHHAQPNCQHWRSMNCNHCMAMLTGFCKDLAINDEVWKYSHSSDDHDLPRNSLWEIFSEKIPKCTSNSIGHKKPFLLSDTTTICKLQCVLFTMQQQFSTRITASYLWLFLW